MDRVSYVPKLLRGARRWIRVRLLIRRERLHRVQIGDSSLLYPSESVIGASVASGAGWEPTLVNALELLVPEHEPSLIVEVGSNIGVSLAQMIAVRPQARYVCFEPSQRFRDVLLANVAANGWNRVTVESVLVAAAAGDVRLYTNTSTASAAVRDYGGHEFLAAEAIPATTLDDYFSGANRLDFLKSDTDGFDGDVLIGAKGVLERFSPALYFEFAPFLLEQAGREPSEVLALLRRLGYSRFIVFAQDGTCLHIGDDPQELLRIAEDHGYVDLVTASRPEQLGALDAIALSSTEQGRGADVPFP
jgi:FkbM family methyltransferase